MNRPASPTAENPRALSRVGQLWCTFAHGDISWPVDGHYQCKKCRRVYRVPWAGKGPGGSAASGKLAREQAVAA